MKLLKSIDVEAYKKNDLTRYWLDQFSRPGDMDLICQKWLWESAPKRFIFEQIYGDLFADGAMRQRILDIGGGLTCFTRELATRHNYHLVDVLAHDDIKFVSSLTEELGQDCVHPVDWFVFEGGEYDLVTANDIFPNVDQRFEIFLTRFLPQCRRLRVSLTWYDQPRFYKTRRMDGDEIFFMQAWDRRQLATVLEKFASSILEYDPNELYTTQSSLYANGRQVCLVEFIGGLG